MSGRVRRLSSALLLAAAACHGAVSESPRGPALPTDHPPVYVVGDGASRASGRVAIAQLRGSLPVVMGNDLAGEPITWTAGAQNAPGLITFSRALGEADFANVIEDNLEPSPLYLKFAEDAARDVCEKALAADYGGAAPRTVVRHVGLDETPTTNPMGFERNLRYLKLRFHGVKVADDDAGATAGLRKLFTASAAGSNPVKEGWRAVCVALLTAPEFHLY